MGYICFSMKILTLFDSAEKSRHTMYFISLFLCYFLALVAVWALNVQFYKVTHLWAFVCVELCVCGVGWGCSSSSSSLMNHLKRHEALCTHAEKFLFSLIESISFLSFFAPTPSIQKRTTMHWAEVSYSDINISCAYLLLHSKWGKKKCCSVA